MAPPHIDRHGRPDRPERPVILLCKWHPKLAPALVRRGARVHIVIDDYDVAHMNPDQETLDACANVYRVTSMDSLEELSAVAVDLLTHGVVVDHVVSHVEFGQFGASYLDLLLRPDRKTPAAYAAARDKRIMKKKVAARGVPVAKWESISDVSDERQAARVAQRLTFPVVVKPVAGLGSMSTVKVGSPEELRKLLADFPFEPVLKTNHLMAEEFVDGRELIVESLWHDGSPQFMYVSEYYQPRLDFISNRSVADGPSDGARVLPREDFPDLHRRLRELHELVNSALEIKDGPTHLEVFEQPDGRLVFSEIATRPGGFFVSSLSSAHLGRDYWDFWAALLVGDDPGPVHGPTYLGAVHLTADRPGEIVAMPDEEAFASFDGALYWGSMAAVGDRIEFSHSAEWCAFVILGAQTMDDYDRLAAKAARELRVHVR